VGQADGGDHEFRKPQDDYGHHVIAVEVGIEDEVGVIANPGDKKSGGSHRLLVTADLPGAAAAIAPAQLAQEAREAVSEGGSGHLTSTTAVRREELPRRPERH